MVTLHHGYASPGRRFTGATLHQGYASPWLRFTRATLQHSYASPGRRFRRATIHKGYASPGLRFTRATHHQGKASPGLYAELALRVPWDQATCRLAACRKQIEGWWYMVCYPVCICTTRLNIWFQSYVCMYVCMHYLVCILPGINCCQGLSTSGSFKICISPKDAVVT